MRILHVVATGRRRGAETFASDLIRELNATHVSQRVAVIHASPVEVPFDAPRITVGVPRSPAARIDPVALWRLRRIVGSWRPHVVQAHGGEALRHAVLSLAGTRIPIVYRRIGLAPGQLHRWPRRSVYGGLMRRTSRVVTVADSVRQETMRLFRLPGERVVTIPNGVDGKRLRSIQSRSETRRSLGIPADATVLASVGAITWEKDPVAHLRVTARVLRRADVVHLWVGDGPMRSSLRAAGSELGLDGRLVLAGSRADVGDLLEAADVLIFASRSDGMEGMPASVIEAGMAGLAVAGYAVAGVPEVVVDGATGYLVRPGDEPALADRVLELVEDRAGRCAMGDRARERCVARFDIGAIAPRYLSLYGEVIGSLHGEVVGA